MPKHSWIFPFGSCPAVPPLFPSGTIEASDRPDVDTMVLLKAGCFNMGSEEFSAEEPIHKVCVSVFYMQTKEVTQQDFSNARKFNPSVSKGELRPVENITWPEADTYCHPAKTCNSGSTT
ncbi:MAG: SUMF1/EgtB/PvdO family nonheme iron enzyme [Nitrospinaceae bacterium]|nr:SUMF1/EgtB/PvdO family nonheme iron enzyme [Nitrospinaceae bacterium]